MYSYIIRVIGKLFESHVLQTFGRNQQVMWGCRICS